MATSSENIIDLLEKATLPDCKNAVIKTLWKARESLKTVEPSKVDQATELLLKIPATKAILSSDAGRSLLAYILTGVNFVPLDQFHAVIKCQLLCNYTKARGNQIGRVYLQSWKAATSERKQEIETICIQAWLRCSICTQGHVATTCLEVLRPFTKDKQTNAVATMLCRLAEPLIWRSLTASHRQIRYNALELLLLLFPLRNYDESSRANRELFQRQLNALEKIMFDRIVGIRIAATLGACKILNFYWEVMPLADAQALFIALTDKLPRDSSSADVRAAVYQGMALLAKNEQLTAILEKLLPKLMQGLHDKTEKVRLAVVNLLTEVRAAKLIKLRAIVPLNQILLRLAVEENPTICKRIVALLMHSFWPVDAPDDIRLQRTLALMQENGLAARKFYEFAHEHVSTEAAAKQLLLFLQCVYMCVLTEKKADADEMERSDEENADVVSVDPIANQETMLSANDKSVIAGMLGCAAVLWNSIGRELSKEQNSAHKKRLNKCGSKMIFELFRFYKDDERILNTVMCLSSMLQKSAAKSLASSFLRLIKEIPEAGFDKQKHGSLVEATCYINLEELVLLINEWWQENDVPVNDRSSLPPAPKRSRRVQIVEPDAVAPKPLLGMQILSYLLNRTAVRSYLLNSHADDLQKLDSALKGIWKNCLSTENRRYDVSWSVQIVRLRAAVIGLLASKADDVAEAADFLTSYLDLLKHQAHELLPSDSDNESAVAQVEELFKEAFANFSDFVKIGLCNNSILDLCLELLSTWPRTSVTCITESAALFYSLLKYFPFYTCLLRQFALKLAEGMRIWLTDRRHLGIGEDEQCSEEDNERTVCTSKLIQDSIASLQELGDEHAEEIGSILSKLSKDLVTHYLETK